MKKMKRFYKQLLLIFFAVVSIIIFGYVAIMGLQFSSFDLKGLEDSLMSQLEKFKIPL